MANFGANATEQLREITECPICMSTFTDPRILPCIQTFCCQCLKRTAETAQKKSGDKMPCPLCRKEFIIAADGMNSVQKNFFMENLLEFKIKLQMGSVTTICDMCNVRNEGKTGQIPKATMKCLQCKDNYCNSCVKVHQFQNLRRNHQVVNIGSDTKSETNRISSVKYCSKHTQKPLDYYCSECKNIVCVSCFVENHASHKCKDVTTVDEEFRQVIEKNAWKMSSYAEEIMLMKKEKEIKRAEFLKEKVEKENAIRKRNKELKDMIDQHTSMLLAELFAMTLNQQKQTENEMEEIDRSCIKFRSFEAYCTELRLKGSASDICGSVDGIIARADELEKDHEAFIGRPSPSVTISFQPTDFGEVLQKSNNNILGQIKETAAQFEEYAIVMGINGGATVKEHFFKINLHRPNEISIQQKIPTSMSADVFAAVNCNTMYVTGIGLGKNEIWKYNMTSGWMRCASLVQARHRHSAVFIDEILYVCGGIANDSNTMLDSVEAFNPAISKSATVGKLVHCVKNSGNCVPFRNSLYIFGGSGKDNKAFNHVQVYNTKQNTCTLLSKPMPQPQFLMQAVVWETSVILLGCNICFLFDTESETWQERNQFHTGVHHFGLVLMNKRVFVIGGGICEKDRHGYAVWKCRDDVRYVPLRNILEHQPFEWKIRGKLPRPSLVRGGAKLLLQA